MIYGPVTNENSGESDIFGTDLIQGDMVTLELFEPKLAQIVFDYRMINKSNEDIVWYDENDLDKPFYPIFDVYRGVVSGNLTLVGSTHQPYIFYGRWGSSLPAADSVSVRVTWLRNEEETKVTWGSIKYISNSALPKGQYVVKFEQAIKFSRYEGLHVNVQLPFEVL